MTNSSGANSRADLDVTAIIISYHPEERIADAVRDNEEALAHFGDTPQHRGIQS